MGVGMGREEKTPIWTAVFLCCDETLAQAIVSRGETSLGASKFPSHSGLWLFSRPQHPPLSSFSLSSSKQLRPCAVSSVTEAGTGWGQSVPSSFSESLILFVFHGSSGKG